MHTTVMVAFYPAFTTALKLSRMVPHGTKPADLHLTLAFLGEAEAVGESNRDRLNQTVADFAAQEKPIQAMADGLIRFCAISGDGDQPICASVSSPDLSGFRQRLVETLESQGFRLDTTHGFQPHMTLAYIPKNEPSPIQVLPETVPVRFDEVAVVWMEQKRVYRLGKMGVRWPWN